MQRRTLKISKEVYDIAMQNKRHSVPQEMELEVFGAANVYGYGVYGNYVYEKDGEYFVDYETGDTCD